MWCIVALTGLCHAGGTVAAPAPDRDSVPHRALIPPEVVSILRNGPSPTAAPEVAFGVLFSEAVTGVDIEDFELEAHNLVGEAILSVTGSGAGYTVLVASGEGAGVIEVHLRDNDTIRDVDNNALGGPGLGNGDHECDEMYIVDRRGPEIALAGDNPLVIECGDVFIRPNATAFDTTYGDVSGDIAVTGDADADAVGDYEVTYTVSDPLGNTTELVLAVHVRDTSLPEIALSGANPLAWPCSVPYVDPGAAVTDVCDAAPVLVIDDTDVDPSHAGSFTVVLTATDASGNVNQAVRVVNVAAPCGEGEGEPPEEHTADQDGDGLIELSELLRVIQFYNSGGFHCADDPGSTEDGYVPGPGANETCSPHNSDYAPPGPDWQIALTELLRIIQFYNSGGYHYCPGEGTEDGFCPGAA